MQKTFTPREIAEKLQISTTTLRRYEDLGLIPDVSRTNSNRRIYTQIHVQAFLTLRSLIKGFDIPVSYKVMRLLKNRQKEQALWTINLQLYSIQVEKQRVEEVMHLIQNNDFSKYRNVKLAAEMKIGEIAAVTGVNTSAIRHWEKEGLIRTRRNPENGYRVFTSQELKKIFVLSSLRKSVFSIAGMKQLLAALELQDLTTIERSFKVALHKLNEQLEKRMIGISEVMKYAQLWAQ